MSLRTTSTGGLKGDPKEKIRSLNQITNFVNGQFVPAVSAGWIDNVEPATGEVYCKIADSDSEDVEAAVNAAVEAAPQWGSLAVSRRSMIMQQVARSIEEHLDLLAMAEAIDNGKPLELATSVDIPRAARNFHFFGTAIEHMSTEAHVEGEFVNYTTRDPLGVVGCISPWNLPLYLFSWKIAPALAAGNTVVAKPSELAPMTAFLLCSICQEAGLPDGVLNVVHGLGSKVGQAIVEHPQVKAISFTGGTATGRTITRTASDHLKKLSLELGGKNPNLIFADCDMEEALSNSLRSSFSNQGQICLCGSRILVEEPVYEEFRDGLVSRAKRLSIGDPLEPGADIGALISEPHLNKVISYVELAKEEEGTVLTGGNRVTVAGRCESGFFMEPTIIEGLDPHCRVNQEEVFGPLVTLIPFSSEDQAIEWANCTPYGLAGTIWTKDLSRAHRVAQSMEAGVVWINCWMSRDLRTPFGGTKQSGIGREGGWDALRFFTEAKNICIRK